MSCSPRRRRFDAVLVLAAACAAGCAAWTLGIGVAAVAASPRFYTDDPIAREPDSRDASVAKPVDVGLLYDLSYNLFITRTRGSSNVHARNVNTIDEVPDSSWFTNRIQPRQVSVDDAQRGPNTGAPPNPERWTVTREKSGGFAPGFTAKDANGETWFLSFDPPGNPEGATAAMVIGTKIFWTLGYNQVETFLTKVDPAHIAIDPKATMRRPNGKRTPMSRNDLKAIFDRAARNADGTYRAAAGRLLPGKVLGPFRYEGTRTDDPNDIVDHQHRRELRALRVFGAWTNLTDLKAGNTLDTLVTVEGRSVVRHYLQDVGSTFGIGANGPHDWDEGFEYYYERAPMLRRLASFGFWLSPWQTVPYTIYPSIGRFEGEALDPPAWKPHVPTRAFLEMLPDDAFWAARRVAAFDDDLIRAIVHTGGFSDARAEQHFAAVLIQRRDKVVHAYLPAVNPIVDPRLGADGQLRFENAAAGVAPAPAGYRATWTQFDNATGDARPLGETVAPAAALAAPPELPRSEGVIVRVSLSATGTNLAAWQQPEQVYFRRTAGGWTLIGLDRGIGDATAAARQKP
jgi:hypothetical protein